MELRTSDHYRRLAEHFATTANDIKFPGMAERLRELARHYTALADGTGHCPYPMSAQGS